MKCIFLTLVLCAAPAAVGAAGLRAVDSSRSNACDASDIGHRALIQAKLAIIGDECVKMCKRVNAYPNCQCPGFDGVTTIAGDERDCMAQYCQDPKNPCPNDGFVTCVNTKTKVSTLQWPALLERLDSDFALFRKTMSAPGNHTAGNKTR